MEGLIIGSDRVGALWVEVKTLCGFKPCLVSVSVGSGNDTEDVFPVGLVAGVPWIGEWHGEVRGEIFGGIPGQGQEESCQLTEVSVHCAEMLFLRCTSKTKINNRKPFFTLSQAQGCHKVMNFHHYQPLLPAEDLAQNTKHIFHIEQDALTGQAWNERQVCGMTVGINMF